MISEGKGNGMQLERVHDALCLLRDNNYVESSEGEEHMVIEIGGGYYFEMKKRHAVEIHKKKNYMSWCVFANRDDGIGTITFNAELLSDRILFLQIEQACENKMNPSVFDNGIDTTITGDLKRLFGCYHQPPSETPIKSGRC